MRKNRAATFFDAYAKGFESIYDTGNTFPNLVINAIFRRSMRLRFEKTIAGCQPLSGKSVLDVGCGGGHYSIYLAQAGAARVVGIDFAKQMLKLAMTKAEQKEVSENCSFIHADFANWEAPAKFDYTILMGFMDYIQDARSVIARAISMTKGRLFFSFPIDAGFLAWQRRLRYRRKCDLYMYSRGQIEQLFADVGGCTITVEKLARDYFVTASILPEK